MSVIIDALNDNILVNIPIKNMLLKPIDRIKNEYDRVMIKVLIVIIVEISVVARTETLNYLINIGLYIPNK